MATAVSRRESGGRRTTRSAGGSGPSSKGGVGSSTGTGTASPPKSTRTAALRVYVYAGHEALVPLAFVDYADGRDADPDSGKLYHVFCDGAGMPLHIEDERREIVWWATRADPWGRVEVHEGATVEYNLRWAGHYLDSETGLHYNRYRYYDPGLGRYLTQDPIGYRGSDVNLYAYCSNPLVQVDVLGLAHKKKGKRRNGGDGEDKHDKPEDSPDFEAERAAQQAKQEAAEARKLVDAQRDLAQIGALGPRARADLAAMPGGSALLASIDTEPSPTKRLEQVQVAAVALSRDRQGDKVQALERSVLKNDGSELTRIDVETQSQVIEVKGKDLSGARSLNRKTNNQAVEQRAIARNSEKEHVFHAPSISDAAATKLRKQGSTVDDTPFPYHELKD